MNDSVNTNNATFGGSAPEMVELGSAAGQSILAGNEPQLQAAPVAQAAVAAAPVLTAAPAQTTGTPITQLFPTLKAYTKEQLGAMTSEQLQQILTGVNQTAEQVNGKVIQLSTQIESVTTQLTEMTGRLQSEFGVSSVEELDQQRQQDLQKLEELYGTLALLNLETTS